jgi:hypothetical protein
MSASLRSSPAIEKAVDVKHATMIGDGKAAMSACAAAAAASSRRKVGSVLALLGLAAVLAGCGDVSEPPLTGIRVAKIELGSPAFVGSTHSFAASKACRRGATLPPLKWGRLPPDVADLAVFVFSLTNVHQSTKGTLRADIVPQAAVTGLSPDSHEMLASRLPRTAIASRHPYSICPARGANAIYLIRLYAMRRHVNEPRGFDERTLLKTITPLAVGVGSLTFNVQRA